MSNSERLDWNRQIIEEFRAKGGSVESFGGRSLVLLHHVGAKSGMAYVSPLAAFPQADGGWVIVASNAGRDNHPAWYHNLQAHPETVIEAPDPDDVEAVTTVAVKGRVAGSEERERLFAEVAAAAPGFAKYQEGTARVIPVVVLERAG